MKTLKLVPVNTSIGFIRHRTVAMALSALLVVGSDCRVSRQWP